MEDNNNNNNNDIIMMITITTTMIPIKSASVEFGVKMQQHTAAQHKTETKQ